MFYLLSLLGSSSWTQTRGALLSCVKRLLFHRMSFYICSVIDSFCFSQPARHELRPCFVRPVAAKLVDNKTKVLSFWRPQGGRISVIAFLRSLVAVLCRNRRSPPAGAKGNDRFSVYPSVTSWQLSPPLFNPSVTSWQLPLKSGAARWHKRSAVTEEF